MMHDFRTVSPGRNHQSVGRDEGKMNTKKQIVAVNEGLLAAEIVDRCSKGLTFRLGKVKTEHF